ncbi:MAG: type I restriction enzyme HsdR N-terminal domain-containing protein [Saprospiraceae bacterium]|nr:type I restriction enzyme HsdR N-terminal domain-containing protein [Saprospiraceae bacterium]
MAVALKTYCKKYLNKQGKIQESDTRIMIDSFLSDVLTYIELDEISTEFGIQGAFADYLVHVNKTKYFIVEVKAFSIVLRKHHLRQAINYAAGEGIHWAILTNGRHFELHRVIVDKRVDSVHEFSIDLTNKSEFKKSLELLQFLHRDSILKKSLKMLLVKSEALDYRKISGLLYAPPVIKFIKKYLRSKFKSKFLEEDINKVITDIISNPIDISTIKPVKAIRKPKAHL